MCLHERSGIKKLVTRFFSAKHLTLVALRRTHQVHRKRCAEVKRTFLRTSHRHHNTHHNRPQDVHFSTHARSSGQNKFASFQNRTIPLFLRNNDTCQSDRNLCQLRFGWNASIGPRVDCEWNGFFAQLHTRYRLTPQAK